MSTTETPQEHWEGRYAEKPQMWSGRVNANFAKIAGELPLGRALDLGCGEGADAIWLATEGWQVVAVDIATNALDRARSAAEARGVAERIDFQHHDLSHSFPTGSVDLAVAPNPGTVTDTALAVSGFPVATAACTDSPGSISRVSR